MSGLPGAPKLTPFSAKRGVSDLTIGTNQNIKSDRLALEIVVSLLYSISKRIDTNLALPREAK
jgi:hypothetical protein